MSEAGATGLGLAQERASLVCRKVTSGTPVIRKQLDAPGS